jgi:hypothetical protein
MPDMYFVQLRIAIRSLVIKFFKIKKKMSKIILNI